MQKQSTLTFNYFLPRIQDAIFVALLIAVFLHGPSLLNEDGDLGRHITIGDYIRENWTVPTHDIFSHTMTGQPLVPHEWLAQVALSFFHSFAGLAGVILLIAVLLAATFTLTYQEMRKGNVSRILALLLTLLAAYTSSLHWLARPHIFTLLFTAIWAYQLANENSKVWLFPFLMWIWANTHGAYIVGFVIWAAHIAGWFWEYLHNQSTKEIGARLVLIGAASFAVTFLNPAGWHLWGTSVGYFGSQFLIDRTVEYQSPNFHSGGTWPFLTMLAFGILVLSFKGRLRPHESILFAGLTVMSLYSARNIPLFAIVIAPYIGSGIQSTMNDILVLQRLENKLAKVENSLKGYLWPLLAVLGLTVSLYIQPNPANQFDPNKFPVKAAAWLEANPQKGNMFNYFTWGGYLLYRLWPQETVFIDGQTDFYGEALTREYEQAMYLHKGWELVLKKYNIAWAIVPSSLPLVKALQTELKWVPVYQDGTTTILHQP